MQDWRHSSERFFYSESRSPTIVTKLRFDYLENASRTEITNRDVSLVDQITNQGSPNALQLAGAVALDLAARSDNSESEQIEWLINAHDFWQRSIEKSNVTGLVEKATISSAIGLAVLPSYRDIIYDKKITDTLVQQKMYSELCEIALLTDEMQRTATDKIHTKSAQEFAGILAELAVLLLHQRFVIQKLSDESMLALPAKISEDNGIRRRKGSHIINSWDISVLTQTSGEDPVLTYKVQVKTLRNKKTTRRTYADDIAQVAVSEDLLVTNNEISAKRVPIRAIPLDCKKELIGIADEAAVHRLDDRTDKLLEILG